MKSKNTAKPKTASKVSKPTKQELSEWLNERLSDLENNPSYGDGVDTLLVEEPSMKLKGDKLAKHLKSVGLRAKLVKSIVSCRNKNMSWDDIIEHLDENCGDALVLLYNPAIEKALKTFADGKHEWERVVVDVYHYMFMADVYATETGWKTIRKAFDKGGYKSAIKAYFKLSKK